MLTLAVWLLWRIGPAVEQIERLRALGTLLPFSFVENDEPIFSSRPEPLRHTAPEMPLIEQPVAAPLPDQILLPAPPPTIAARFESLDGDDEVLFSPAPTPHIPNASAFALAEAAFTALSSGDRRAAAAAFRHALSLDPAHLSADLWRAQLDALEKRWSASAYMFLRSDGAAAAAGTNLPLLGGGQSGAALNYVLDPLARRPVFITARAAMAHGFDSIDEDSAEAAIGVGWHPLGRSGPLIAAERRIAIGVKARDAWQLRIAGGGSSRPSGPVDLSAYGEAGVTGLSTRDLFAGAQMFGGLRLLRAGPASISAGAGAWGSYQRTGSSLTRIEAGPALRASIPAGSGTLDLRASYRFRLHGRSQPGSGPAVTLATSF